MTSCWVQRKTDVLHLGGDNHEHNHWRCPALTNAWSSEWRSDAFLWVCVYVCVCIYMCVFVCILWEVSFAVSNLRVFHRSLFVPVELPPPAWALTHTPYTMNRKRKAPSLVNTHTHVHACTPTDTQTLPLCLVLTLSTCVSHDGKLRILKIWRILISQYKGFPMNEEFCASWYLLWI